MEAHPDAPEEQTELMVVQRAEGQELALPDVLADPKFKRLLQESTIAIHRPGLEAPEKKARIPKGKELVRIIGIAAALGYFGYDVFLKESKDSVSQVLRRSASFRPTFPLPNGGAVNTALQRKTL